MSKPRSKRQVGLDVVAARAVGDSRGIGRTARDGYLAGYLELLVEIAGTGRRLTDREIEGRRVVGADAAGRGVALRTIVDLYLNATWRAWSGLPGARSTQSHDIAGWVLRAANDVIVALADGFEQAQRLAIRVEEGVRREFIDDLLHGGDVGRLAERAGRFGLQLAGFHVVAVVGGPAPFGEADARTRHVEQALLSRLDTRNGLVTTKDSQLVCIAPTLGAGDASALGDELAVVLGRRLRDHISLGRPYAGPGGVARSYDEARTRLDLAQRLDLPAREVRPADLLLFQVLGRDRAAIADLVQTVLAPLQRARGGAKPLLDALTAYFGTGSATAAATTLRLSVRATTYRLSRIKQLTGYDATAPDQRFTLQTAVLGARLLNWPAQPLP